MSMHPAAPDDHRPHHELRPRRTWRALGALAATCATLALVGCTSPRTATPAASVDPAPTRVVAAATGTLGPIVFDPNQMADFPCHGMGTTLMGTCTDEDLALLADIVRAKGGKGVVELPKKGAGAAGASSPGGTAPAGTDATSPAGIRDLGDGITFDPNAMKDAACHAMFGIIMGRCNEADIQRLADEIRAQGGATGDDATRTADRSTILPGSQVPGIAREAQLPVTTFDLADGARLAMAATVITRTIGGRPFPGYGYNGEVGGPILRVAQGSQVSVDFTNRIDMPTTVHWHGLRHANKDDGVPGVTQPAVQPGGAYGYTLAFPDPGVYWYHPHVREDIQQDGGMYGIIVVTPTDPDYFNPVDREEVIVLDDLLIEDGRLVPFGGPEASFTVMGRFGNTMLVNGRDDYRLDVRQGEVVRFFVVNTANVRPYSFGFDGARMKRVGGDLGKFTADVYMDRVLIAPAERAIVEVLFDRSGTATLVHETPDRTYALGTVAVAPASGTLDSVARRAFDAERVNTDIVMDMRDYLGFAFAEPDVELELDIDMPSLLTAATAGSDAADATDDGDGEVDVESDADGHGDADNGDGDIGDGHGDAGHSVEWEDDMLAANRQSTAAETRWVLRDAASGAENEALAYSFTVGDVVKIRIRNLPDSVHPMQHPIHIHGQRFVVVARNGQPNRDLVWKDTVLVPIGETVDLVMDVTNPGAWMVHCHIAEHLETGMMFQFNVTAADGTMPEVYGDRMSHGGEGDR
ncbi:MAG: multicopper oxidase family protein [Ardenticatenales bacterium]|nr:multicopper oxidase family protein [Ardenticatenales bacterium]